MEHVVDKYIFTDFLVYFNASNAMHQCVCWQEQRDLKRSLDDLKEVQVLYEQEQRK